MNTELIEKLEKLLPLTKKYDDARMRATIGEEHFISKRCEKPTKRHITKPSIPQKPSKRGFVPLVISSAILLLFAIITVNTFIKTGTEGFGFGLMTLCIFLAIPVYKTAKDVYDEWWLYKRRCEEYEEKLADIQPDINYNEYEYPRLLELYNKNAKKTKEEYNKQKEAAKKEMADLEEEIAKLEIDYPKSHYIGLYSIINKLKDGSASTLKEAMRQYDDETEKFIRELDEKKREEREEERRRRETNRQFELLKEIEDRQRREEREKAKKENEEKSDARRRCSNCIHRPNCRAYGSINCGSYIPRKGNYF